MVPSSRLIFGRLALLLPLSAAAPTPTPSLYRRQTIDCNAVPGNFDESCWDTLDLTDWLSNWSLPTCTNSTAAGADCCKPDDTWSKCFLRVAVGADIFNCTQFNSGDCAQPPTSISNSLDPQIVPKVWYVVKNIFAINAFFTTWNQAINAAATDASLISDALILAVDPQKKTHVFLNFVLTALSIGLSFIGAPEVGIPLGLAGTAATIANGAAKALVAGIQKAPSVAQAIWPKGTTNSQPIQLADLQADLASQTETLSNNLNSGLGLLMSDIPSFVAFAQSGYFSGDNAPSLTNDTDVMGLALRTYVISSALSQNDYQGMLFTNNSNAFLKSGTINDYCNANPNACYTNTTTGITYRLGLQGVRGSDNTADLMNQFVQNSWTTPGALYQGSFQCAASGNFGQSVVNYGMDGSADMSCLSQLIECSTDEDPKNSSGTCPTGLINGGCPIRWCVSQV